jgi:hypothetical protein
MPKKKAAVKKKAAPKKSKTKTKKAEAKAPAKKAEPKAKAPKAYRRAEGAKPLEVVRHQELDLNGRKCHRVELLDGTSDIVPEADPLNQLVW